MNDEPLHAPHRWLIERIPGVCVIETDRSGVIAHFSPAAETFLGCTATEVIGRLHYEAFHDPAEMQVCRDDPEFREQMKRQGWSENDWTVVPREGKPFRARVTLVRRPPGPGGAEGSNGWIALYRRLSADTAPS